MPNETPGLITPFTSLTALFPTKAFLKKNSYQCFMQSPVSFFYWLTGFCVFTCLIFIYSFIMKNIINIIDLVPDLKIKTLVMAYMVLHLEFPLLNILSSWVLYWCFVFVFSVHLLHPCLLPTSEFLFILLGYNLVKSLCIVAFWNLHIFSIYYYDKSNQIITWLNQITLGHSENKKFLYWLQSLIPMSWTLCWYYTKGVRRTVCTMMSGIICMSMPSSEDE